MTKVEAKLLFDLNELEIDGGDRFIERAKDVLLGDNEEALKRHWNQMSTTVAMFSRSSLRATMPLLLSLLVTSKKTLTR